MTCMRFLPSCAQGGIFHLTYSLTCLLKRCKRRWRKEPQRIGPVVRLCGCARSRMRYVYLDPSAWVKRYYHELGTELTNQDGTITAQEEAELDTLVAEG